MAILKLLSSIPERVLALDYPLSSCRSSSFSCDLAILVWSWKLAVVDSTPLPMYLPLWNFQ